MDIDSGAEDSWSGKSNGPGSDSTEEMEIDAADAVDGDRAQMSLDMIRIRRQETLSVEGLPVCACFECH
jgi:hypothetical protein